MRLRPDGSRDPSFGRNGLVRLRMLGYFGATATLSPGGDAILSGSDCCSERYPALHFVSRLTRGGRIDRSFAAATRRSLRGVAGTKINDYGWESTMAPIFRSGGRIDLYASTSRQIVAIRLRQNGSRALTFGHHGVRLVPLAYGDAAPDGAGGAFVVGYRRGGYQVRRVRPDGGLDRMFGRLRLIGAQNEEGLTIFSQGHRRAIVLARDESIAGSGRSDPTMYRVVDPSVRSSSRHAKVSR
jgi:hypothetical protein